MVEHKKPGSAKVAAAALAGSSIENYDFFIYGTAAALVFPELFFPEQSQVVGTALAFSTFAVGFVARPLGGVIFGHLGDSRGRKQALIIALTSMGIASVLIGLLPTYAVIGVAAPLLLVLLRFLQGIAVGGQLGGVVLLATESAPEGRRGFFSSFAQAGGPAGIILGNLVFILMVRAISPEAFETWGWRVPFLASAVLIGLSIYIQLRILETRAFRQLRQSEQEQQLEHAELAELAKNEVEIAPEEAKTTHTGAKRVRLPVVEAFRTFPKQIALVAAAYIGLNVTYYLLMTYVVSYATNPALAIPEGTILTAVLIGAAVQLVTLPISGAISDRFGRRRMLLLGSALLGLWSFAFWPMIDTKSPVVIVLALVLALGLFHTIMYGPQGAFFAETFSTSMRYSGISMGVQIGALCGGAFAPLIATALFASFNGWIGIAVYMAGTCAITFVAVSLMRETHLSDIDKPSHREQASHVKATR